MNTNPPCAQNTQNPIIPVSENGRTFTLKNPNKINVTSIKVDGCAITANDQERCDHLFDIPSQNLTIFVELKGAQVQKAVSQIENTIKLSNHLYSERIKKCFVVASRVPMTGPEIQSLQVAFMKRQKKSSIKFKTNSESITI